MPTLRLWSFIDLPPSLPPINMCDSEHRRWSQLPAIVTYVLTSRDKAIVMSTVLCTCCLVEVLLTFSFCTVHFSSKPFLFLLRYNKPQAKYVSQVSDNSMTAGGYKGTRLDWHNSIWERNIWYYLSLLLGITILFCDCNCLWCFCFGSYFKGVWWKTTNISIQFCDLNTLNTLVFAVLSTIQC